MMKQSKWVKLACLALYIAALILVFELFSSLVLNHVISPTRLERFDSFFLGRGPYNLPHPYLDYTHLEKIYETDRYLSYIGEDRANLVYVVALGGSTTESGYPEYTEAYLNKKLESINSSLKAVAFNFGVEGWTSPMSLQNYVYVVRYLHPDFVIIHHNTNDAYNLLVSDWVGNLSKGDVFLQQAVLSYPRTSRWERILIRDWRFYKLLKLTYLLSYNSIHYGALPGQESPEIIQTNKPDLPPQARLSSYLNGRDRTRVEMVFTTDFIGGNHSRAKMSREFLLTETYESLIGYTRADNSTLIITTQYLNYSKDLTKSTLELERVRLLSREINDLIRGISKEHNVTLVDLDKEMEPFDHLLQEDGVHFQGRGIKIKGELIGEAIFEILRERYNLGG